MTRGLNNGADNLQFKITENMPSIDIVEVKQLTNESRGGYVSTDEVK